MKILIAEDDAVSRMILCRAIEKFGHECLVAEDGQQAWEMFEGNPDIEAIVSDWMMPNVDGLELCRRVRKHEEDQYTYVIFLTALGDREHMLKGLDAGADDYLSKPLDRDELQVRLVSASRVTSLHRRLAEQNRELENLNLKLHDQSRKDALTGLGNRLRLSEEFDALRGRADRYGHGYCLALCDVDYFKSYNDHYGHQAGDEVLRRIAGTIAAHCRSGDAAYRYGGEEFLLILPEQSLTSGRVFAERLRRSVEDLRITHEAKEPPQVVTISTGVAALPISGSGKSVDELLGDADAALYEAKEAGRNRVVVSRENGKKGVW